MNAALFLCLLGYLWMHASAADPTKCLRAHNVFRRLHDGTPDLVWDAQLAHDSTEWAKYLVSIGRMKHSYRTGEGENIYYSKSKSTGTCASAALAWYNEIKDYNYGYPGFSGATGHFTQVIWKASQKVGVGIAVSRPDSQGLVTTFIVAKYTPQGNKYMRGAEAEAFRANVLPRNPGAKTPTVYQIDPSMCKDNSGTATCNSYKAYGFCEKYRSFMGGYCAKTCKLC